MLLLLDSSLARSDFDSLVASELSPADSVYHEIVLFRSTQVLPVYLVKIAL